VSTDVLGAIIQRVSGLPLDRYLAEKIFAPLKMHDTGFAVPAGPRGRGRHRPRAGPRPALGVAAGDRVATLAWNTQAHVEVWYAIMGMGAVCHTLNPRLTAEHLASMIVQSRRAS
jgi:CubicO group peptidase (beta-lactamase class C family)